MYSDPRRRNVIPSKVGGAGDGGGGGGRVGVWVKQSHTHSVAVEDGEEKEDAYDGRNIF